MSENKDELFTVNTGCLMWSHVKYIDDSVIDRIIERTDSRIIGLKKELEQQRFNNKYNLSIDQKVSNEIAQLEQENRRLNTEINQQKKLVLSINNTCVDLRDKVVANVKELAQLKEQLKIKDAFLSRFQEEYYLKNSSIGLMALYRDIVDHEIQSTQQQRK